MIRQSLTPQELCEFMNELIKLDPEGINRLVRARVQINNDLAEHPTVQVGTIRDTNQEVVGYDLGLMGILNGLFGTYDDGRRAGWGCIQYTWNTNELVTAENSFFRVVDWT